MIDTNFLMQSAAEVGFSLTEKMLCQFDAYANLLVEWNKNINLTTITEPQEIVIKHFVDSLLLLNHVNLSLGKPITLIDVGTGAGFPSLPCKIVEKNLEVTLFDSLNKRLNFLRAVCENQDVKIAAKTVHGRAEDFGAKPEFREKYDIATARAVAHLCQLAEYCLPFVKVGGDFIALKGYESEEEIAQASHAIAVLGGEITKVAKYELKDGSKRAIVCIRKVKPTPPSYPRSKAQMTKNTL